MIEHATVVDPDGHRVTFENDAVRVVEVHVPVGRSVPIHSHPARVLVSVSAYTLRSFDENGVETVVERLPGQVGWSDGQVHSVEVVAGPAHAIEVEIKR